MDNAGSIHGGGFHKAEQLKSIYKKLIIDIRLIFYIAIEIDSNNSRHHWYVRDNWQIISSVTH